ncbi:MAG TPA: glycosyl hydrolase family 8, partial [Chloroflexota bacterium]|nr:glycosyl hydrolase family 8 [Chloroflexota bacterium]
RGLRDRRLLAVALLGLVPLYYLGRGGVVFDYYLLCAIPFLCLNLAMALAPLLCRLPRPVVPAVATVTAGALVWGYWTAGTLEPLFTHTPSRAGREAIAWIKAHVPPQSLIITRDDLWTDLREPGLGGPGFPGVHSHWKVAADPEVRLGVFKDDWRTVDYLIMSPGLDSAFAATGDQVALDALRNARPVRRWEAQGSIVELWKVNRPGSTEAGLLAAGTAHIAARFERGGAFVRPDGTVASESQAYAMLRAVWSDDRAGFDRVWRWTEGNLRNERGLLSWLWRDGAVVDRNGATDADTDAALALLFAGRRWDDPALTEAGRRLVRAIWEHEVVMVRGRPYLSAGEWAADGPLVALNPSYFSPYAYRIFKVVDPEHDWWELINTSYEVLFAASAAPLGAGSSAGLPPDWVGLERATGGLVPLQLERGDTTRYGFDAARAYWRVALDQQWTSDGRARAYLAQAGFLRDEVQRKGEVSAVYARDGTIVERAPSLVGQAGALAVLMTLDPPAAHALYADHLVGRVAFSGPTGAGSAAGPRLRASWGDPNDLYTQDWAWFSTALYAGAVPDLWNEPAPPVTAASAATRAAQSPSPGDRSP